VRDAGGDLEHDVRISRLTQNEIVDDVVGLRVGPAIEDGDLQLSLDDPPLASRCQALLSAGDAEF
jgi:hypothetical protein